MNTKEYLEESCMAWIEELEKIGKGEIEDLGEWINDNVLEIQRLQSLSNGKWETNDYVFLVSFGGPNIWIDGAEKKAIGYWGLDRVEIPFTQLALEGYERLFEYLKELEE